MIYSRCTSWSFTGSFLFFFFGRSGADLHLREFVEHAIDAVVCKYSMPVFENVLRREYEMHTRYLPAEAKNKNKKQKHGMRNEEGIHASRRAR